MAKNVFVIFKEVVTVLSAWWKLTFCLWVFHIIVFELPWNASEKSWEDNVCKELTRGNGRIQIWYDYLPLFQQVQLWALFTSWVSFTAKGEKQPLKERPYFKIHIRAKKAPQPGLHQLCLISVSTFSRWLSSTPWIHI